MDTFTEAHPLPPGNYVTELYAFLNKFSELKNAAVSCSPGRSANVTAEPRAA